MICSVLTPICHQHLLCYSCRDLGAVRGADIQALYSHSGVIWLLFTTASIFSTRMSSLIYKITRWMLSISIVRNETANSRPIISSTPHSHLQQCSALCNKTLPTSSSKTNEIKD